MSKNSMPDDVVMGDMNCLSQGEVDECEVLSYTVQPPSSWMTPWSCPADCAWGEV